MINERLKKIVDANKDRIAYKIGCEKITYENLWKISSKYADCLIREGDSPVILYGNKSLEMFIAMIACLISSRTYVPINVLTPINRIKEIIDMTKASLMITDKDISFDNIKCNRLTDLNKYALNEKKDIRNDIVYIIFTSGTTGKPKGVPISDENLCNFVNWISHIKPLDEYRHVNVLNQASFSFDLSVADIYYSICNGHTLISFNDEIEIISNIQDIFGTNNINVAVMTPTFMKLCLLDFDFNSSKYPGFKCVYFCGERLDNKTVKRIWERFPNLEVINAYGPTEATSAVSGIRITYDMVETEAILPVGEVDNCATEVQIINDEIVLSGKSVFNGYLGQKVDINNIYHTHDIGYIKDDKIYCVGRLDDQIKYKGYRIELMDIENNINKIDDVLECAVIAIYNEDKIVKNIKAVVVVKNNITVQDIKEKLKYYLPDYMIPRTIKIVSELPMNENGKVDRKVLIDL